MNATLLGALGAALLLARTDFAQADTIQLEFVVQVPAGTPADADLFIAGNVAGHPDLLGRWSPTGLPLARRDDGRFTAKLELERDAAVEFKVTRGSWATVEKGVNGEEIGNRHHVAAKSETLTLVVAAWADGRTAPSTVTGTLERQEGFGAKSGLAPRALLVRLPTGYADAPQRRYPVVYLHDGQNLFDAATAFGRTEWNVDEQVEQRVAAGTLPPLIVVGIENSRERLAEYTPTALAKFPGSGRAAAYARLLLDEVKPFVDGRYRTLADRAHTFVGGSSLGGLVSLWLLHEHPEVFGGAAALSPSLWWDDEMVRRLFAAKPQPLAGARLWIDMGTQEAAGEESAAYIEQLRRLVAALEQVPLRRDRDFVVTVVEGAIHHESAWAKRIGPALEFLLRDADAKRPDDR